MNERMDGEKQEGEFITDASFGNSLLRDPAMWAAMQLTKVGKPGMTVGEAMDAVVHIVKLSWDRQRQLEARSWTEEPPTEQGQYWHWNGHRDCGPEPMFVLFSGTTGKCFVSKGQLGLEHAVDCDEYGGWWMRMIAPPLPR